MQYRKLGTSDLEVSTIAIGSADFGRRVDQKMASSLISAALDAGVNFIDTAEAYPGSEEVVAKALIGCDRRSLILATKFGHPIFPDYPRGTRMGSRANVRRAIEGSLKRLGTDYIDLYYIHRPDPETPVEETLAALDELVAEGKVRFAGASNYDAGQVAGAAQVARSGDITGFVAYQSSYSLLDSGEEAAVVAACREAGAGFVAYSPLARGLLSGRYRRDQPIPETSRLAGSPIAPDEVAYDRVETLATFARERGISIVELAIGGLLASDGVSSIIVGASSVEQLLANIRAAEWTPTTDDIAAIDRAGRSGLRTSIRSAC